MKLNHDRPAAFDALTDDADNDSTVVRALYLASEPDPVFATAHLPTATERRGTGVLLCPPFGWEEMCTYRTRRVWANALAQAGHPALRIDLPGTNDSAGSPRDPDRLAAWSAAVADAARWLREEAGCRRVAGLGIGFGGMMAWLAAAQGAPIDDLLLWAVPTRGDRLLRHMRAAALINVDSRLELDGQRALEEAAREAQDAGLVEMFGRLMTQETVDAISRLDLRKLPLSDPERRRVLVFARSGLTADQRLVEHFEAAGANVSVASGDAYGAMMQYATFARVPDGAIADSVSWLSEDQELPAPSDAHEPFAAVDALDSLELVHDGVAIRETPLTLDLGSEKLFAILTEPVSTAAHEVCAVLFNPGADRRVGPCRLWVETARRWAAGGTPTIRLDQPGIGDSDGDCTYSKLAEFYDPRITDRTKRTLDALQAHGLPGRFVLVGYCSGGVWSINAGLDDDRVAGIFAINLPFFFWSFWAVHVLHGWWVRRERRADDRFLKAALLGTLKRASRWTAAIRRTFLRLRPRSADKVDRTLEHLRRERTEVLLMFRLGEPLYQQMVDDRRLDRLERMPNVQVKLVPGRDRGLRPLPLQRFVSDELDAGLSRVLESERPHPATQELAQVWSYSTVMPVRRNSSTAKTPA